MGFLLPMIGLVGPSAATSPILFSTFSGLLNYFSAVMVYSSTQTLLVGLAALLLGSIGIAAGYFVWRRSTRGAILAAIVGFSGEILVVSPPDMCPWGRLPLRLCRSYNLNNLPDSLRVDAPSMMQGDLQEGQTRRPRASLPICARARETSQDPNPLRSGRHTQSPPPF